MGVGKGVMSVTLLICNKLLFSFGNQGMTGPPGLPAPPPPLEPGQRTNREEDVSTGKPGERTVVAGRVEQAGSWAGAFHVEHPLAQGGGAAMGWSRESRCEG